VSCRHHCDGFEELIDGVFPVGLKPNSITLASSELTPNMFGASSELASVMEFGFYVFMFVAG